MKVYHRGPLEADQFNSSKEQAKKLGIIRYRGHWYFPTLRGDQEVLTGDWIVNKLNAGTCIMTDKEFQQQYAGLPVIPKNVAGYIVTGHGLNDLIPIGGEIYRAMIQTVVYGYQKGDIGDWIINHSDMFARAWLDGYTVEEDK